MFKKIIYSFVAVSMLLSATSCNDWLDVKPNNEQITDDFWKSKEDVDAVVLSGYVYLANSVPTLIKWGELRGGSFYTMASENKLQDFNLTSSHSICNYGDIYKIINAANSVLNYAPQVRAIDATYHESIMNAHLCEAYFLRAYSYLILMKNFKEVPLVLVPYVDDTASFDIAKSTEAEIVAQIKADVETALATGAANGWLADNIWENQGRVTKWALYALMADVCLWSEDYATCKEYCDKILNADDALRPVFIKETSKWFDIFCPGNSNEGIFEVCWNYQLSNGSNNNFMTLWTLDNSSSPLRFTNSAVDVIKDEAAELVTINATAQGRVGRLDHASVYLGDALGILNYANATNRDRWKYRGNAEVERAREPEK
ncbi:MAG: RagB/SusD family nutrient uptake outer membrane protein, partial [Duncaniella sp.]|nr:RagB/SusD family nutrient uptake outer membrane protein [Duncaniella sp.]